MNFLKKSLFFVLLFGTCFIQSCSPDEESVVLGCTDPEALNYNAEADTDDETCTYTRDKIVGNWDAIKFFFDTSDVIASGEFTVITFEFEEDGDFEWNASGEDSFFGSGDWEVDGDYLEIEFNAGAVTFCGDADHRFLLDFDGDDELNLEDNCNDGTVIKIELDKN